MTGLRGAGCLAAGGSALRCTWSLEGACFRVSPEGGTPRALDLGTVHALAGDGHSIRLVAGDAGPLELSRLGAGGATLLDELWRTWPEARARALRIQGDSEGEPFAGTLESTPCRFLLHEGALLAAPEGRDLAPLFLPLLDSVRFDPETYAWRLEADGGEVWTLSRLAGRTQRFGEALAARRGARAAEAEAALAVLLPAACSRLAGTWLPGRFRSRAELEALAPGLSQAVQRLAAAGPRNAEAEFLLASPEVHLAMARPDWTEAEEAGTGEAAALASVEAPYPLWALARLGGRWILEALTEGNHATYLFSDGSEVPGLVSRLFCAPHLPLAALHQPESTLTPDHLLPARELPFLRELRARFRRRVVHGSPEAWRRAVDADGADRIGGASPTA